jgi:hypothetical protein
MQHVSGVYYIEWQTDYDVQNQCDMVYDIIHIFQSAIINFSHLTMQHVSGVYDIEWQTDYDVQNQWECVVGHNLHFVIKNYQ